MAARSGTKRWGLTTCRFVANFALTNLQVKLPACAGLPDHKGSQASRSQGQSRPISCSSSLWNETRDASFHHFIQSLSGFNSIDFVKRVFRKTRDVEILSRAGCSCGCGKHCRAALHRPSQQHLCRGLSNSCGDSRNDWVFEQPGPHPVT